MASMRDWEKDLNKMSLEELADIQAAFQALKNWDMFEKEYHELEFLRSMVQYVIYDKKQRRGT